MTLKFKEESKKNKEELSLKIQDLMNQILGEMRTLMALQGIGKMKENNSETNEEIDHPASNSTASLGGRGLFETPA